MASFIEVRNAIADVAKATVPGISVHARVPMAVTPPVGIVRPARPAVTYREAYGSGFGRWKFELLVLMGKVIEQTVQDRLAELVAPGSELVRALNETEVAGGYLAVQDAYIADFGPYASASLTITGHA